MHQTLKNIGETTMNNLYEHLNNLPTIKFCSRQVIK